MATEKYGGGSVIVWSCMSAAGVDNLVFIQTTMDSCQKAKEVQQTINKFKYFANKLIDLQSIYTFLCFKNLIFLIFNKCLLKKKINVWKTFYLLQGIYNSILII